MKFIAIEDIGDYKEGDTVPIEKAMVWEQMYDNSPVKRIEGKQRVEGESPIGEDPFMDELISIHGIGKATAKDIMKVYPTKEELVNGLSTEGEKVPFRDDVVDILLETYKKE